MRLIEQFIQITTQKWASRLGIKIPVYVITDKATWSLVYPHDKNKLCNIIGSTSPSTYAIFVDLTHPEHNILLELEDTILHELLHIKYPKKKERELDDLVTKYLKKYYF